MGIFHVNGDISTSGNIKINELSKVATASKLAAFIENDSQKGFGYINLSDILTNLGITATAAELNYVDGVTSNIQTQLNGKSNTDHTHNYAGSSSAGGEATRLLFLDGKINRDRKILVGSDSTSGQNVFQVPNVTANYATGDFKAIKFTVNSKVSMEYDTTNNCLNFVFK